MNLVRSVSLLHDQQNGHVLKAIMSLVRSVSLRHVQQSGHVLEVTMNLVRSVSPLHVQQNGLKLEAAMSLARKEHLLHVQPVEHQHQDHHKALALEAVVPDLPEVLALAQVPDAVPVLPAVVLLAVEAADTKKVIR